MEINKEREAFEAWYEQHHNGRQIACDYVEEDNSYSVGYANAIWVGWQAAKATPEGFVLMPSGVLDLTRFMCETWTEIDKFVYKNCQNLELYPLIQGSKTQSAIRKIGKQKFNPFVVGAGIQAMIEAQEQSHD